MKKIKTFDWNWKKFQANVWTSMLQTRLNINIIGTFIVSSWPLMSGKSLNNSKTHWIPDSKRHHFKADFL